MELKKILIKVFIRLKERKYKSLKYLFFSNNSDTLIIGFSGMSKKPSYNYVRTLKNVNADKLFLLDDFAYCGSYHWFSDGTKVPLELTTGLIQKILKKKCYKKIITIGSSKGGTCAIYFGLLFNVSNIFAGAPQYYVGTYLNGGEGEKDKIFKSMMGKNASEDDKIILDSMLPNLVGSCKNKNSIIHLLYSKNEHTYSDDIVYLIKDLELNCIKHLDKEELFTEHSDVGKYFSMYIYKEIKKLL